jgi:hypothetical protein
MHAPILIFGDFITRDWMTIFVGTTLIGYQECTKIRPASRVFIFMGDGYLEPHIFIAGEASDTRTD